MNKSKFLATTLLNVFIFITTAIAVPVTLIFGSRASRLDDLGFPFWQHIVTFTILSNIFLGLVSLVTAIIAIIKAKTRQPLPKSLTTWYLTAATAAMITCLTVLFFLAPMRAINSKDYFDMLLEPMFFLHFLNPILSAVILIFFLDDQKITLKSRLLATLPVIIYSFFYLFFVVIIQIWPDFYGVTFGGKYFLIPLVLAAFFLVTFSVASLLSFCHNHALMNKRRKGVRVV